MTIVPTRYLPVYEGERAAYVSLARAIKTGNEEQVRIFLADGRAISHT